MAQRRRKTMLQIRSRLGTVVLVGAGLFLVSVGCGSAGTDTSAPSRFEYVPPAPGYSAHPEGDIHLNDDDTGCSQGCLIGCCAFNWTCTGKVKDDLCQCDKSAFCAII
jgi:hypothetical protein